MTDFAGLALATAAFVGSHLALAHPLRLRLVQTMGEWAFGIVYSLVAFVTLGGMVLAYHSTSPGIPLWIAPDWAWPVASALMLLASILLLGSLVRNPAFPVPGAIKQAKQAPIGVFAITRHPMNWSFILWALVHIGLWGAPRNLIVASGILILAVAGSIGQDRKKRSLIGPAWQQWESRTSFVPFAALLSGKIGWRALAPGWVAVVAGLVFWLVVTWFHAPAGSPISALLSRFG